MDGEKDRTTIRFEYCYYEAVRRKGVFNTFPPLEDMKRIWKGREEEFVKQEIDIINRIENDKAKVVHDEIEKIVEMYKDKNNILITKPEFMEAVLDTKCQASIYQMIKCWAGTEDKLIAQAKGCRGREVDFKNDLKRKEEEKLQKLYEDPNSIANTCPEFVELVKSSGCQSSLYQMIKSWEGQEQKFIDQERKIQARARNDTSYNYPDEITKKWEEEAKKEEEALDRMLKDPESSINKNPSVYIVAKLRGGSKSGLYSTVRTYHGIYADDFIRQEFYKLYEKRTSYMWDNGYDFTDAFHMQMPFMSFSKQK